LIERDLRRAASEAGCMIAELTEVDRDRLQRLEVVSQATT
jgi:hypothetical protein